MDDDSRTDKGGVRGTHTRVNVGLFVVVVVLCLVALLRVENSSLPFMVAILAVVPVVWLWSELRGWTRGTRIVLGVTTMVVIGVCVFRYTMGPCPVQETRKQRTASRGRKQRKHRPKAVAEQPTLNIPLSALKNKRVTRFLRAPQSSQAVKQEPVRTPKRYHSRIIPIKQVRDWRKERFDTLFVFLRKSEGGKNYAFSTRRLDSGDERIFQGRKDFIAALSGLTLVSCKINS